MSIASLATTTRDPSRARGCGKARAHHRTSLLLFSVSNRVFHIRGIVGFLPFAETLQSDDEAHQNASCPPLPGSRLREEPPVSVLATWRWCVSVSGVPFRHTAVLPRDPPSQHTRRDASKQHSHSRERDWQSVWNTTDLSTSSQTSTTPHHAQKNHFLTLLKIVPLALYLRAAACKFSIPVLGCDGALCPVAIGKKGDCVPTANTAEQMAWCEHAWTPWTNGLLAQTPFDYR